MRTVQAMSLYSAVVLMGISGVGCQRRVALEPAPSEPTSFHIEDVPFFADSSDQCGPSTLAALLSFWGRPTTPDELRPEIYIPKLKGTLPMDLLPAAEARGVKAEVYNGTIENLKSEIRNGHPQLAYLNLGYSFAPAGHYVLVTGYDDDRKGVFMHSGKNRDSFVSYSKFLRRWNKTDRWTLRVLSSDQVAVPQKPS